MKTLLFLLLLSIPQTTVHSEIKKLSSGEKHVYPISLQAGQFLKLTILSRRIIFSARVNSPNQETLARWDAGPASREEVEFAIISPVTGIYKLIIEGAGNHLEGTYQLEIHPARDATERDKQYVRAQNSFLEGKLISKGANNPARQQALAKYLAALNTWRELQETSKEVNLATIIATIYSEMGDNLQASVFAKQAFEKAQGSKSPELIIKGLLSKAEIENKASNYRTALEYGVQALQMSRQINNQILLASSLNAVSSNNTLLGNLETAKTYIEEELKAAQAIGDLNLEANATNSLAVYYESTGDIKQGIALYQKVIDALGQIGERDGQAWVRLNLAGAQINFGELQAAINNLNLSLEYYRATNRAFEEGRTHELLGSIANVAGNIAEALLHYEDALPLYRKTKNRNWEGRCLMKMGNLLTKSGEAQKGKELLLQALAIHRETQHQGLLTQDLISLGVDTEDVRYLTQALEIARKNDFLNEEMLCLLHLSRTEINRGELEKSRPRLEAILAYCERSKHHKMEAEARHLLALTYYRRKDYAKAQTEIKRSIEILEKSREGLLNAERRAEHRNNTQKFYEFYIDTLVNQGLLNDALEAIERSRAQTMVQLLNEYQIDFRQNASASLLQKEKELEYQLALFENRLLQAPLRTPIEANLQKLSVELGEIRSQIKATNPAYDAIRHPTSIGVAEIQRFIGEDTILLEYALGEKNSYLFAVTKSTIKVFPLPGRAKLNEAIQNYTDLIRQFNSIPSSLDIIKRQEYIQTLNAKSKYASQSLGKLLIPLLTLPSRLLIVPDGSLFQAPFASLIVGQQYLITDHQITTAPSVLTLMEIRRQFRSRPKINTTIALFADPIFSEQEITSLTRAGRQFNRLPNTRKEAETIASYFSAEQKRLFLGAEANRANLLNSNINSHSIIHIATHGVFDLALPGKSGIMLSQFDKTGAPINGLITISDTFNLKLSAELVVLSGCQTATGRELQGEGILGISRGFMYSGGKRILSSLWDIDDNATAKLMTYFYQALLQKQMTPSAALQFAQIEMSKDKRWSSPYYWGAFTLHGDW